MGNLGVHTIAWESRCCELGYWILGDFEGRGYMSEAIIALESVLFELGFQCLEIRCDALNQRSAKLPQRLGYTLEATLRTELKSHPLTGIRWSSRSGDSMMCRCEAAKMAVYCTSVPV